MFLTLAKIVTLSVAISITALLLAQYRRGHAIAFRHIFLAALCWVLFAFNMGWLT